MASRDKRTLLVLLIVAEICISLVSSASSESIMEEQMPYKQFSLLEVKEPTIP